MARMAIHVGIEVDEGGKKILRGVVSTRKLTRRHCKGWRCTHFEQPPSGPSFTRPTDICGTVARRFMKRFGIALGEQKKLWVTDEKIAEI